jgi:hypothetical protein
MYCQIKRLVGCCIDRLSRHDLAGFGQGLSVPAVPGNAGSRDSGARTQMAHLRRGYVYGTTREKRLPPASLRVIPWLHAKSIGLLPVIAAVMCLFLISPHALAYSVLAHEAIIDPLGTRFALCFSSVFRPLHRKNCFRRRVMHMVGA